MTTLTLSGNQYMETMNNPELKTVDQEFNYEEKVAPSHKGKGLINRHGREGGGLPMPFVEQIRTAWSIPYARAGIIAAGVSIAMATYFFWPQSEQVSQGIEGRDGVATVSVATDHGGELNAEQAKYLSERQRQEALEATKKGETNAAVIVVPTATVEGENLGDTSTTTAITADGGTTASKTEGPTFLIDGINPEESSRFERRIDSNNVTYYHDKMTGAQWERGVNGQATPRKHTPYTNPTQAQASEGSSNQAGGTATASASAEAPANTLANTNYQSGNTNGTQGSSGGDGSGASGGNGDGGAAIPSYDASQDADVQRYRNQMANYYNDYVMQQQTNTQNAAAAQQGWLAQQQQLQANRQQLAQNSLSSTLSRLQGISQSGNGFSLVQVNPNSTLLNRGGANGSGGSRLNGSANGGVSASGNLGTAGEVASTLASDPTYYSRQATEGLVNGEDPNYSFEGPSGSISASGTASGSASSSSSGVGSANQRLGGTSTLPSHVIRAGTQYTAVITRTVNSDYGNTVEAKLVTGPFAGSIIYGQLVQQGRDVGVVFNSLKRPGARLPIIPMRATATNIANDNPAMSTNVNRHYLQNYGHIALTSALQGYGDAYANRGTTTVERTDGTVVTTRAEGSSEEVRREIEANIAQQFSQKLQQDMAHLGNRPPTFIIAAGKVVNVRLNQDWDTTQTSSSIY